VAIIYAESSFPLITFPYVNSLVGIPQIQFCVDFGIDHSI